MKLFKRKNAKPEQKSYNREEQEPVIRKSICTGEMTAGFKDLASGRYHDVMLIRNEDDLKEFMDTYGIAERPKTEY